MEHNDYKPEWGYLGGLVITEVTRGLLTEMEDNGNWRWDLINESSPTNKIYIISSVEPDTQAMSYQEYGLDLIQSRIYSINGTSLNGKLSERLAELHRNILADTAPASTVIELENNISIQLNSSHLQNDMLALVDRYPTVAKNTAVNPQNNLLGMMGMGGMTGMSEVTKPVDSSPLSQRIDWGDASDEPAATHTMKQQSVDNMPSMQAQASPQG